MTSPTSPSSSAPSPPASSPILSSPDISPRCRTSTVSTSSMKDITATHVSSKHCRNAFYSKKRPSPHGVAKSQHKTPLHSLTPATRKTPAQQRASTVVQCPREAHAFAMKRDGKLLEEEYRTEVLKYMYDMERSTISSATSMDQQPEIKWHMRPCLVDFLVETHLVFKLRPETLYLTLNIIDRYCSRRVVFVKHYQLVGCAALWIAAKFEDAKERVPSVHDLHEICRETYDITAFIQMEYHILSSIQWIVGHPTAEAWLRLTCCNLYFDDQKTGHVARFLMEITLFHREFIPYTGSSTSQGALILAQHICDKSRIFNQETEDALEVADLLDDRLASHLDDVSEILLKKYGYAFYSKASNVVVQFYLSRKRFLRMPHATMIPVTPIRSSQTHQPPTPLSASTSCSSVASDDLPVTPTRTPCAYDPFLVVSSQDHQKENSRPFNAPSMEPFVKRGSFDGVNEVPFIARPALQNLNSFLPSPRPMVH